MLLTCTIADANHFVILFLLTRRPPISTLFPYTTLFRSLRLVHRRDDRDRRAADARHGVVRGRGAVDRKSTRLNSSHANTSYAVFCLKKKARTASSRNRPRSSSEISSRGAVASVGKRHRA